MEKCKIALDARLLRKVGKAIELCFDLIESYLLNNTDNQFSCSVTDLSKNTFVAELNKQLEKCLNKGGIYFIRITTSENFKPTQFKTEWDGSRSSNLKKPKANPIHNGQFNINTDATANEYVLYVGSSLVIGSRIKEHFWSCDKAKSTYSLRLNCNPNECLKQVLTIKVNYICFDGLSDENNKEAALHNLCRYYESKMRKKYQALIGR